MDGLLAGTGCRWLRRCGRVFERRQVGEESSAAGRFGHCDRHRRSRYELARVGQELSETGAQITRRNLNVQPTIKVPVGYKFTVRVNRDILFEAPYEPIQAELPAARGPQLK